MIEVTEKEASSHITIPRSIVKSGVQELNVGTKAAKNQSTGLALPNVAEVNRSLESRQAENSKLDKAIIPDFIKAEEDIKNMLFVRFFPEISKVARGDVPTFLRNKETE